MAKREGLSSVPALVKLNAFGGVECGACQRLTSWRLEATGRVLCVSCGRLHPHIAWYDDEADVIAQVDAESYAVDSHPHGPAEEETPCRLKPK